MTRYQLTFMVGLAIGRWSREHGHDFDWREPGFEDWVDQLVNDALALTEDPADFEREAQAGLNRLFGEEPGRYVLDQTTDSPPD